MDHTRQYEEGETVAAGEGVQDGFYLIVLGNSDIPTYFSIADDEVCPGDYVKILDGYTENVALFLRDADWIMYGSVHAGRVRLVCVINFLAQDSVYPCLYVTPGDYYPDGQYLGMIDNDHQKIEYFEIDQQPPLQNKFDLLKLLSLYVDDVRKTLMNCDAFMLGNVRDHYFHVDQRIEINDF